MISSAAGLGWEANLDQLTELLETTDWDAAVDWFRRHGKADYMSTKQAMCAYVARQAHPLMKRGVRINAICPGPTDTPLAQANRTWAHLRRRLRRHRHRRRRSSRPLRCVPVQPGGGRHRGQTLISDQGYRPPAHRGLPGAPVARVHVHGWGDR